MLAKIPGVATPWRKRQTINCGRVDAVAASAVVTASVHAERMITRRKPRRSARRPMNGAKIATATVGAVMVRPASNGDAPNVRVSSGSSGWVE